LIKGGETKENHDAIAHNQTQIQGPCTNEGRELKTSIPQVLKSGCDSCTENERRASKKVVLHLQQKKPNEWKQIEQKYDPTGEYARKYRKLFEN
jgi:hypothetical protein